MTKQKEIKDLLNRFLAGKAEKDEKYILFRFFNDPSNQAIVNQWLKKDWKNFGEWIGSDGDFSAQQVLERIHAEMKANTPGERPVPIREHSKMRNILLTGLKYAAVVLIACGVEWYILSRSSGPSEAVSVLRYNEIKVPFGSKSHLVLADSTEVWLNAGASFRYPSSFDGEARETYLDGEAYFDVRKEKHRPFLVKMNGVAIKVHGTKFNVKAYGDDPKIETTLLEGSIEIIGLTPDNKDNLFMKPGEKLVLYKDQLLTKAVSPGKSQADGKPAVSRERVKIKDSRLVSSAVMEQEIAWRKDKLVFSKQPFDEVRVLMERWYGVTIEVRDSVVLDYRFTGTFDKETFEQAIKALSEAAGFDYELNKKHVVVKKAG